MEQHLAAYIAQALSLGSPRRIDLTPEASCIAGSIYTHLQFRDAQPSNPETQLLKDSLVSILMHLETDNNASHRLRTEGPLLLWILFCGRILCSSGGERLFLANRIASLMMQLQIEA
jgi:hypothetical protein